MQIVLDADAIIFRAAAASQLNRIKVTNKINGEELVFKSRTDFWGHHLKKAGGWLAEQKASGATFEIEDFEIVDTVKTEPPENAIQICKTILRTATDKLGSKNYYGYAGGKNNFRDETATLLQYKGTRDKSKEPVHRTLLTDYMCEYQNCTRVDGKEADDAVSTDQFTAYKKGKNLWAIVHDKDYRSCEGQWFYFVTGEKLKVKTEFGKLYLDDKGEPKGHGRVWKYYQVAYGDDSDNYFAHAGSEAPNGPLTAFKLLVECKDDQQALEALVGHFKRLYPEDFLYKTWRGDLKLHDWLSVMQEMFDLVHMQRWEGDRIIVKDMLERMKIEY
jgi:hypothetical protein